MSEMRDKILSAARATVQAQGYGALSFRVLAKEVGIKSASIHYHFPTKADLGAVLAQGYTQDAMAAFEAILASDPAIWMKRYTNAFRAALERNNRMCLCGILAAEYDGLPAAVRVEVAEFADGNVAWLTKVLLRLEPKAKRSAPDRALAIYSAVLGAQLVARSRNNVALFDQIIKTYRNCGLIPDGHAA